MPDYNRPDHNRWPTGGGDPSLHEINRVDRFLDALGTNQRAYSTDRAEAELAFLLSDWRDDIRDAPMTAPVTQQGSEKIAMTAPVTQEGGGDTWRVRFIMPAKYTLATLPKPNNPAIALKEIPEKRFAVIRFSGMAGEESLKRYNKELSDFLSAKRLTPLSPPTYAFYNPPWTLPFLRRNEVLVEIARPAN